MDNTATIQPKVLRTHQAAAYIGIATSTFWRWVKEGKLPQGILLSPRCRVWDVAEMDDFLKSRKE